MGARLAWIAQRITAVARVLVRASTGTARVVTERLPLVYHVTVVILSAAIASTIPFTLAFVAEQLLGYWSAIRDERTFLVGTEVPVDYKMFNQGERWRAYDVNIEGVSLVSNYRTQFSSIIGRHSYQELVVRLRAKQEERAAQETTGRPGESP